MFLSLSTWLYDYVNDFEIVAKKISKMGYKSVEMSGINWGERVWKWEDILRYTDKYGLKITSVHCHHHAAMPASELTYDVFCRYHEEFYKRITPHEKGMIIVEHGPDMNMPYTSEAQKRTEFMRGMCKQHDLTFTLENVPHTSYSTPQDIKESFYDGASFTFDAAHYCYMKKNPADFKDCYNKMVNVHAYDVNHKTNLGDWLPSGLGMINWPALIQDFKASAYDGPITVELNEENLKKVLNVLTRLNIISADLYENMDDVFAQYSYAFFDELINK